MKNRIFKRIIVLLTAVCVSFTAVSPFVSAQEEGAVAAASPFTGDTVAFWLVAGIIIVAVALAVIMLLLKKKGKKNQNDDK